MNECKENEAMSKTLGYSDPVASLPFFFSVFELFLPLGLRVGMVNRMVGYVMAGSLDE